jgi:hypothetical protein
MWKFFFEPAPGPDILTSPASQGISRIHWKDDVLTLFTSSDPNGPSVEIIKKSLVSGLCDSNIAFNPGGFGHSRWHKDQKDKLIPHFHIYNLKTDLLHPKDLRCLLNNIKTFEHRNNWCTDGEKNCLLSDKDLKNIQDEYEDYYRKERMQRDKSSFIEVPKNLLWDMSSVLFNSFIQTLMIKYLKPYLIDKASQKGFSQNTIILPLNILNTLMVAALTGSIQQAVLNTFIVYISRKALTKAGIDISKAETIAIGIGAYFTTIKSYASLLNVTKIECIRQGQSAAYALIHRLPKLKYEEPPLPDNSANNLEKIMTPEGPSEGLTRRKIR